MEIKPDKQASKAALDKERPTQTTDTRVSFPERQKLGEEPQVPERVSLVTEPSKSPNQTSDQLVRIAAVQKKLQARDQHEQQIKALEEKIERLNEMRQICQNVLTLVKQLQR
ncbi:hypothetical protein KCU98_g1672, partial [Aureobasidium melanogenum]